MTPDQFPSFDMSKRWAFAVSHNYNETTQDPKSPEFFLSLLFQGTALISRNVCYSYREHGDRSRIPAFRFVIFEVTFPQDDESHSHTFTSFPILFDGYVRMSSLID